MSRHSTAVLLRHAALELWIPLHTLSGQDKPPPSLKTPLDLGWRVSDLLCLSAGLEVDTLRKSYSKGCRRSIPEKLCLSGENENIHDAGRTGFRFGEATRF